MFIANLLQNPFLFLVFIAAIAISITVHEYAHAFVAYRSGDSTAKLEGRLTLNPLAHLDPLGTLFLFLIGFGWGKPVPINPRNFKKRSDELKVAFAGIVANILLAFVLALPLRLAPLFGQMIDSSALLSTLNLIVEVNLVLAAFNLLPLFPLDGSHLVEYFLEGAARETFQSFGPYLLLLLILMDRISGTSILITIMEPLLRLLSFLVKGTFSTGL